MSPGLQGIGEFDAARILGRAPRGELWQGSLVAAMQAPQASFDCVVFCALEAQPTPDDCVWFADQGVEVIAFPSDDARLSSTQLEGAWETAARVVRRVRRGKRVLVTCMQGRNRSGLVVGLATHMLTNVRGADVVSHIKRRRCDALTNQDFVAALRQLPGIANLGVP